MSILDMAKKPAPEPIIGTLVGAAGAGKTTMACTFGTYGKCILIRTQGESVPVDLPKELVPDTFPELTGTDALWSVLQALRDEEHDYKVLIVDSVTGLEELFVEEVLAAHPEARGLAVVGGGFGIGFSMVSASHGRVRRWAEHLRKKRGMTVIFLAHEDTKTITPPDADPYTQRTLRLNKNTIAHYVDRVNIVGFIKQSIMVRNATEAKGNQPAKPGRVTGLGERVLVAYSTPAFSSKNRLGIEEDIEIVKGVNPLDPWLPRASKRQRVASVESVEAAPEQVNEEETAS